MITPLFGFRHFNVLEKRFALLPVKNGDIGNSDIIIHLGLESNSFATSSLFQSNVLYLWRIGIVGGHSKAATDGHFKTGHFQGKES